MEQTATSPSSPEKAPPATLRAVRNRRKPPRGIVARKRADGSVYYKAWVGSGVAGGKLWSENCATIEEAELARVDLRKQRAKPTRPRMTFLEAFDATKRELEMTTRPGTVKWFEGHRKVLLRDMGEGEDVAKLRKADVIRARDRWIKNDKVGAVTVQHRRRALGRVFTCEAVADVIESNPVSLVSGWPTPRSKARHAFRADEVQTAVDAIRNSGSPTADLDALVVHALFATGLRRSELARVRVRDVRLDAGMLAIDGKRRSEPVPLGGQALAVFRRLLARLRKDPKPDTLLLPGDDAAGVVSKAFTRTRPVVEPLLKNRAWSPHMARHTFVSLLAAGGVDLGVLQRYSRIDSIAILRRYLHSVRPDNEELKVVDKALSVPAPEPQLAKVE